MPSQTVQAAKLVATYIYKKETLGIDVCMDSRVFQFINKHYASLCNYTSSEAIESVEIPDFNSVKTCTTITSSDITLDPEYCIPINTNSQCRYTVTGIKQYPNRITINGTTINFSAYNLATESLAFQNFVKTFLDSQDFTLASVLVSGTYDITITSTSDIISIRAGDDVGGTNNTVYVFNKDCRL